MSLSTVQKWVLSTLSAITVLHMAVGLVIAAAVSERLDAKIGLLVIAGAFGVLAVVAALVIHKLHPLSPFLLLGLLPSLVGAWVIFG
jgi:uncharacterized membrane protein YoaK (UPF0700 family)